MIVCIGACKDPIDPIPPIIDTPIYDGELELVWQVPLSSPSDRSDTSQFISMPAVLGSNGANVIFSRYRPLEPSPDGDEVLASLNTETGAFLWENSPPPWTGAMVELGAFAKDGLISYNSYHDIHVINESNGTVLWSYFINRSDGNGGDGKSTLIDNWIYHIHQHSPGTRPDTAHLVRADIHLGVWDTVYTFPVKDDYHPYLQMPSQWIHPSGDEILVLQNRPYNDVDFVSKTDMIAYNVTADSVYWELDSLSQNSTAGKPLIYEDKAYLQLDFSVVCIDILTGEELWRKEDFQNTESLIVSSITEAEGMILVHPSDKYMYALDPISGAEIWVNDDTGETPSDMAYHDGIVYYSSSGNGRLYAIRISNGETIWAEKSPNNHIDSRAIFKNSVTINADLSVLYASDSFFAMSIKLAE